MSLGTDYKTWRQSVDKLLPSRRPDVAPGEIDPNAAFQAFTSGQTPVEFVSQPVLPIRATPAQRSGAAPSPSPQATGASRAGGIETKWLLAGIAVAVVVCAYFLYKGLGLDYKFAEDAAFREFQDNPSSETMEAWGRAEMERRNAGY